MIRISLIERCVHLVTPLSIMVAFFFFLRGHNEPGGGFIAGLVLATAFVLYAIAFDLDRARRLLPTTLDRMFSIGLFISTFTGIASILLKRPFLTSAKVDISAGVGIKPITPAGSKRLVKRALDFAIDQGKPSVTLVHKGNIMKTTEGGFRAWGYELAEEEYKGQVVREGEDGDGVIIKDRIADAMFQNVLMYPEQYSVIATTNLNGDYISDALAAQVGGLGLSPGVNMGDNLAFFEPTHGTAPTIAGKDMANPGSLILSGAMMLEHIGWHEAANLIHSAVEKALADKRVTVDLASQINGATQVGCQEFGEILLNNL